jgi:hypothetical protein
VDRRALRFLPAFLVLGAAVLAGCMTPAATTGEDEDPGVVPPARTWMHDDYEVVLRDPFDASDCAAVEILFEVPREHALALVPEGFEPASSPVSGANAALVLELRRCASHAGADGRSAAYAQLLVLVERAPVPSSLHEYDAANRTAPEAADQSLEFYALAAYSGAERLSRFFRQSGLPFEAADVRLDLDATLEAWVRVEARLTPEGAASDALVAAGGAAAGEGFTEHRRVWRVSPRGVQLFEEHQHVGGAAPGRAFGSTPCHLTAESLFSPYLYTPACMAAASRVTADFEATGRSYWFHGARV